VTNKPVTAVDDEEVAVWREEPGAVVEPVEGDVRFKPAGTGVQATSTTGVHDRHDADEHRHRHRARDGITTPPASGEPPVSLLAPRLFGMGDGDGPERLMGLSLADDDVRYDLVSVRMLTHEESVTSGSAARIGDI
jgi:hypothetical protein